MIAAALRSAIEKIPTREERLGGQTFKYVKLSEVLDLLDTFHNTHEPGATPPEMRFSPVLERASTQPHGWVADMEQDPNGMWTPGPIERAPQDYIVQCRCGWMGNVSALKSLPDFKRGCPECSVEFVKIYATQALKSGAVACACTGCARKPKHGGQCECGENCNCRCKLGPVDLGASQRTSE